MSLKPPDGTNGTLASSSGAFPHADSILPDGVVIDVPGRKSRRIPIADKVFYDLREFYAGTAQPSDMIGYLHDGMDRASTTGGVLGIPEGYWEISEPMVPPVSTRIVGIGTHGSTSLHLSPPAVGRGSLFYQLPVTPLGGNESWIALKSGMDCPILTNDYNNLEGKRGPGDRGPGPPYVQDFMMQGVVLDHNGRNQSGAIFAVDLRDATGMSFRDVRLVAPRGRGFVIWNCNDCNGDDVVVTGDSENISNGIGDISNASPTVLNVTGTWTKGDVVQGTGIPGNTYLTNVVGSTLTLSANATVTAVGTALTELVYISDYHLTIYDGCVDSQWDGISMHAAKSIILLDGSYCNRVTGFAGYAFHEGSSSGHNLWLRNTTAASPNYAGGTLKNTISLRLEQANGHNLKIDTGCFENDISIVAYDPGQRKRPADADGGWRCVYNDGQNNNIRGTVGVGFNHPVELTSLYHDGPNSTGNTVNLPGGRIMTHGTPGLVAGMTKYTSDSAALYKNRILELPREIVWGASELAANEGTPVLGAISTVTHAMMLDGTAAESVGKWFIPPEGINRVNITCIWVNPTAAAGDVFFNTQCSNYIDADVIGASEGSVTTLFTAPAINAVKTTPAVNMPTSIVPGVPTYIRIRRIATDASDTLNAADIGLLAVKITPVPTVV